MHDAPNSSATPCSWVSTNVSWNGLWQPLVSSKRNPKGRRESEKQDELKWSVQANTSTAATTSILQSYLAKGCAVLFPTVTTNNDILHNLLVGA
jgi:hypothetical protein